MNSTSNQGHASRFRSRKLLFVKTFQWLQTSFLSATVSIWCYKKTRKNKNPYSKGFYIHSAEMNQGYSIFIGKDWPIVPFSPVALHVYHVFPIVFVVFTKELQNCAVVQPDQSGIMLLGSKPIRHQTERTVFINIPGIIGCWAMCLFGCEVSYVYS